MAIILLAFIPVFALTGQEGKLFHPLAFAKTAAMAGATVIAVIAGPRAVHVAAGRQGASRAGQSRHAISAVDVPAGPAHGRCAIARSRWALRWLSFGGALFLSTRIGSEFMPPLNEGDLMFMPIADPSISLPENTQIAVRQDAVIEKFPEVAWVVAKVARADTATDPAALNMTETIVHLKPRDQWRPGMTVEKLKVRNGPRRRDPGVANIWTMPIINRIDMLSTGIRSELGVKVFGADLKTLEQKAREIAEVLRQIPGARDVYPEQVTGALYTDIQIDREAAARYGIAVGDIQDVIETAIGEKNLTTTIEGRKRFPVRVRYAPQYPERCPRRWTRFWWKLPTESQIPLGSSLRSSPRAVPR